MSFGEFDGLFLFYFFGVSAVLVLIVWLKRSKGIFKAVSPDLVRHAAGVLESCTNLTTL